MKWHTLEHKDQLDSILVESFDQPILLFKHSTTCSISSIAYHRLKKPGEVLPSTLNCYYLDLLKHRDLSNEIAWRLKVHHESPQILLIKEGECIFECSHLDIDQAEIKEQLEGVMLSGEGI